MYGVSESAKSKGAYKLLRITDIQDNKVDWDSVPYADYDSTKARAYLLQNDDILFARTGATVGKSYLVKELTKQAIFASYLIRVQASREILPQYIKFYFESGYYWSQISDSSVGTGQPNVNGTLLGELRIPIPPYQEQFRIVSEIERWFSLINKIEANKQDLQEYIKQVKSKVLSLAICGKLESQDPMDEPAIELLRRINPSFVPCDTSHYENLPHGWTISTVGEVAKYSNGRAFKPSEWQKEGLPIIRIQNLNDNDAQFNYTTATFEDRYKVKDGDLLFAWAASLGTYIWQGGDAWLNQHIFKVEPKAFMDKCFLYYSLINLIAEFYRQSHGSGMVHITKGKFENTPILIPPLAEQKRIVVAIENVFGQLDNITAEL